MTAQIHNFPCKRDHHRGWPLRQSPSGIVTAVSPDFGYVELTEGYGVCRGHMLVGYDRADAIAQIDAVTEAGR